MEEKWNLKVFFQYKLWEMCGNKLAKPNGLGCSGTQMYKFIVSLNLQNLL